MPHCAMKASLFQVETQHRSTEKAQVLESVGLGIKTQLHISLLNTKLLMPSSFLYEMRIRMHYLEGFWRVTLRKELYVKYVGVPPN